MNDDELQWIWAYNEALVWLDRCDDYFISISRKKWSEGDWKSFLKLYGVGRLSEDNRSRALEFFNSEISSKFRKPLSKSAIVEDLQDRLQTTTNELRENLVTSRGKSNPPALYSLLSKLLWFHQPERAFMYDSFVAKEALIKNKKNHMMSLENCFIASEAKIEKASKHFSRTYPYPRRVIDKYLWLEGHSEEKGQILKQFKPSWWKDKHLDN